jgi:hypothetical protein
VEADEGGNEDGMLSGVRVLDEDIGAGRGVRLREGAGAGDLVRGVALVVLILGSGGEGREETLMADASRMVMDDFGVRTDEEETEGIWRSKSGRS